MKSFCFIYENSCPIEYHKPMHVQTIQNTPNIDVLSIYNTNLLQNVRMLHSINRKIYFGSFSTDLGSQLFQRTQDCATLPSPTALSPLYEHAPTVRVYYWFPRTRTRLVEFWQCLASITKSSWFLLAVGNSRTLVDYQTWIFFGVRQLTEPVTIKSLFIKTCLQ